MSQNDLSKNNEIAWNTRSYEAWVSQYGTPLEVAEKIQADPVGKLRRLIDYLPALQSLKVANPLGSHGRIATALAILGAEVTVFDISESNARYASELFAAANVQVDYVIGDFHSTAYACKEEFDAVVMELGVVHYFADITLFVAALRKLVSQQGLVVLNDFHPIVTKAVATDDGEISCKGDYFYPEPEIAQTPYEQYVEDDIPTCLIRRWTLGEIVTAFASGGFRVQQLLEHPFSDHRHLPGTFTLVATCD